MEKLREERFVPDDFDVVLSTFAPQSISQLSSESLSLYINGMMDRLEIFDAGGLDV